MGASDRQEGGAHYTDMEIQPWDAMQAWVTPEMFRGFLLCNVIKYTARYRVKGGVEDLRKARHYLDKLIEVIETEKRAVGADTPKESVGAAIDAALKQSLAGGNLAAHAAARDDARLCGTGVVRTNADGAVVHIPVQDFYSPDVSESAAGGWRGGPDWVQSPEWANHWYVDADGRAWWFEFAAILVNNMNWHVQKGRYDSALLFGYSGHWMNAKRDRPKPWNQIKERAPGSDWPGPDWSQAPEWANWWASDESSVCFWYSAQPVPTTLNGRSGWVLQQEPSYMQASPRHGYSGHWRDSLHMRPAAQ